MSVVYLEYADLEKGGVETAGKLHEAFGSHEDALGLVAIRGVPGLKELREQCFLQVWKFGNLAPEVKAKYEIAESKYSVGWSHGKESMAKGKPDLAKGSYYFNPLVDDFGDPVLAREHPEIFYPNVWPKADLPDYEITAKKLSSLVFNTGIKLAGLCDRLVSSKVPSYPKDKVSKILTESKNCKARLLYYFPRSAEAVVDASPWCGWHCDHSCLTGLVPAMFFDKDGVEAKGLDPETSGGLMIQSRSGKITKVTVPSDCLAFQVGESAQILTGGVIEATPHAVKAPGVPDISRVTLAVFMEPTIGESMKVPDGLDPKDLAILSSKYSMPEGVPSLMSRWDNGIDFAEFSSRTISAYY